MKLCRRYCLPPIAKVAVQPSARVLETEIMTTAACSDSQRICNFRQYTPAWAIGTGLRVSLAPGKYAVTREELRDGVLYLCLDDVYRVDSREIAE